MILVPLRGQEKAPAGSGGANSLQGLKRETAPRAEPLLWVRLTSNQFSVGQAFLRFPVAFSLQHARGCSKLNTHAVGHQCIGVFACPLRSSCRAD